MDDLLIDLGIAALLRVLKDPTKSSKWRRAILKLFRAIARQFKTDEEFRSAVKLEMS